MFMYVYDTGKTINIAIFPGFPYKSAVKQSVINEFLNPAYARFYDEGIELKSHLKVEKRFYLVMAVC